MAATIGAAGVAIGAAAAGTAAAIRAQRMKTDPRGQVYGGSLTNQNQLLDEYGNQLQGGQASTQRALTGLTGTGGVASQAAALGQQGSAIGQQTYGPGQVSTKGMSLLNAYQPGQVAAAQQQQALDQGALQNLGAARSGGALGLRNALVANAGGNVQAAQNAAVMRAQEQQQLLGAQVGQANADRTQGFVQQQAGIQNTQNAQQLGAGIQANAIGAQAGAFGTAANAGLNQQQLYAGQTQNVYDMQNANNMTIEQIRQQNAARKSNNLFNLGSQFFGIAGKAAGSMGGGGG